MHEAWWKSRRDKQVKLVGDSKCEKKQKVSWRLSLWIAISICIQKLSKAEESKQKPAHIYSPKEVVREEKRENESKVLFVEGEAKGKKSFFSRQPSRVFKSTHAEQTNLTMKGKWTMQLFFPIHFHFLQKTIRQIALRSSNSVMAHTANYASQLFFLRHHHAFGYYEHSYSYHHL